MAYEHMEYEVILDRMLDRVSEDYPELDTREGSLIYNAFASAALELAIAYTEMDNVLNESFVDTASREYILRKCEEMGIDLTMFDATYGVHRGEFDVEVPIGSRWNCDVYNYEVTKYLNNDTGFYAYELKCETEGIEPNNTVGELTPIDSIPPGLTYSRLMECVIEGEDESSDDHIREIYYNQIKNTSADGNVAQYMNWCESYPGIGGYKVTQLWNGPNTVKVSILNTSNTIASETLVNDFQEYLDPNVTGMGDGVAPIGAFVTVTTATELPIDITATVTLAEGYTDESVINAKIVEYFSSIAFKQDILSYMQLGAAILDVEGVRFIKDLTINGETKDIELGDEEIPILGETTWAVVS